MMARECEGCRHHFESRRVIVCNKFDRRYDSTRIVAREHDPGQCWEAPSKKVEEPKP